MNKSAARVAGASRHRLGWPIGATAAVATAVLVWGLIRSETPELGLFPTTDLGDKAEAGLQPAASLEPSASLTPTAATGPAPSTVRESHESVASPTNFISPHSSATAQTTESLDSAETLPVPGTPQAPVGRIQVPPGQPAWIQANQAPVASKATDAQTGAEQRLQKITFDTIKFEMKKGDKFERSMLTPAIEALKGRTVQLRGYMYPTFQQSGITQFVLVRDNMECCFGPGAMIYDCVMVEMEDGKSTDYSVRPITVEGKFNIEPVPGDDGNLLVLYHLRAYLAK